MLFTEMPLPFPWYNNRKKQHRFRKNCAGRLYYDLLMPSERMLPFQFRLQASEMPTVESWTLYNACDSDAEAEGGTIETEGGIDIITEDGAPAITEASATVPDITLSVTDIGKLQVVEHDGWYYIVYNGDALEAPLECNYYESAIKLSNGQIFWSEVFRVVKPKNGVYPYLQFTWKHTCNLGAIYYAGGYENKVMFDSFLSHSEPELLEEVEKDGYDTEILVFSKLTYRFRFSEVVPDYLKTAMMGMSMHAVKQCITDDYLNTIEISRIRVSPSPEASGCYSFIDCIIEQDPTLMTKACC